MYVKKDTSPKCPPYAYSCVDCGISEIIIYL